MPTSKFTSYRITSLTHFQSTFFSLQCVVQTGSTVHCYSNSQKPHLKINLKNGIHFRSVYKAVLHIKHVGKVTHEFSDSTDNIIRLSSHIPSLARYLVPPC